MKPMKIKTILNVIYTTSHYHGISLNDDERNILAFKASLAPDADSCVDVLHVGFLALAARATRVKPPAVLGHP